jgi:hypothetical protein
MIYCYVLTQESQESGIHESNPVALLSYSSRASQRVQCSSSGPKSGHAERYMVLDRRKSKRGIVQDLKCLV